MRCDLKNCAIIKKAQYSIGFQINREDDTYMTTRDLARDYQLNQVQLETIILQNEMPHQNGFGYLIIDDDNVDFLLELYYKQHDDEKRNENESNFTIDTYKSAAPKGAVYRIEGARGRKIDIYPNKCVITVGVTVGSVISNNATDGEKTIYFCDCIGLQVKKPGLTLGYLQFETAASTSNNIASNFFNENTFTYDKSQINDYCMHIVIEYVKQQLEQVKALAMPSIADELLKLKKLLDCGILSEEEFKKQKDKLLGIC